MKVCPQCKQEYPGDVDFCPSDGTKLRTQRTESEDPLIGKALDRRWVIEEKLGEGGMGAVYRGHQKSVDRTVAIKTLRPQLVDSEEFVDRFFREARIAATISHPNSVTILDYGESDDGTLYLAMEFLDGELLTDRIEAGSLTIKQVLEIAIQVSSALSMAHDNQIVHRDLKPDNIFLLDVPGGSTFVKVLDFGIAKMLDSKTQVTKTGMIFGTPEYMSPEQCRGDKIDGRADLYSLGCIMYELVGGRTPFRATTPMAVLMAHVNQAAPALADEGTGAHVPYEVEQIIMRLLEKNPNDRFEDADQLRVTLENVLHALENPGSTASQELVRPVPSREIVADAVNIGFDNTVGMQGTAPAVPVDAEERRDRPDTDAITPPGRGAPLAVLGVLLICLVGVVGALLAVMPDERPKEEEAATAEVVESNEEVAPDEPDEPVEPVVAAVDKEPTEESEEPKDEPAEEAKSRPKKDQQAATKPEPAPKAETKPKPKMTPKSKATPKSKPKPKPKPKKGLKKTAEELDRANKDIKRGAKKVEKGANDAKKALDEALDGFLEQ